MADAARVWAEAAGQSKQRSVRAIWPELADALDGKLAGKGDAEQAAPQPLCVGCGGEHGQLAIGRAGDDPVCGGCCAKVPFAGRKLTRVSGWHPGRAGHPRPVPRPQSRY